MTRGYLINHLIEQECFPDEECDSEVSQMWHNAINGHFAYVPCVPYEEELALTTWAHVIYELGVDPPLEFDAFYHVYLGWREGAYKEAMKADQKKEQ